MAVLKAGDREICLGVLGLGMNCPTSLQSLGPSGQTAPTHDDPKPPFRPTSTRHSRFKWEQRQPGTWSLLCSDRLNSVSGVRVSQHFFSHKGINSANRLQMLGQETIFEMNLVTDCCSPGYPASPDHHSLRHQTRTASLILSSLAG
jgi:hypothetical protein